MDLIQVLALMGVFFLANMGVMVPMFFWLRSEASADRRELRNVLDQMKEEMKDFHARLCVLEERYLQIITNKQKTDP